MNTFQKWSILLLSCMLSILLVSCSVTDSGDNGNGTGTGDVPNPPTSLEASSGIFADSIQLMWQLPSSGPSTDSVVIYRSYSSDSGYSQLSVVGQIQNFSDISAERDRVYYYYVTGKNSAGESSPSNYAEGYLGDKQDVYIYPPEWLSAVPTATGLEVEWIDRNDSLASIYILSLYEDTISKTLISLDTLSIAEIPHETNPKLHISPYVA